MCSTCCTGICTFCAHRNSSSQFAGTVASRLRGACTARVACMQFHKRLPYAPAHASPNVCGLWPCSLGVCAEHIALPHAASSHMGYCLVFTWCMCCMRCTGSCGSQLYADYCRAHLVHVLRMLHWQMQLLATFAHRDIHFRSFCDLPCKVLCRPDSCWRCMRYRKAENGCLIMWHVFRATGEGKLETPSRLHPLPFVSFRFVYPQQSTCASTHGTFTEQQVKGNFTFDSTRFILLRSCLFSFPSLSFYISFRTLLLLLVHLVTTLVGRHPSPVPCRQFRTFIRF